MKLEGSCHCGRVRFSCESRQPWPYQRCYCSICRKTGGGGGYLINLGADRTSLVVSGEEHLKEYRAMVERDGEHVQSAHRRLFCAECGTHLWAWHERWPELMHPVASAIDTALPRPPANVHMMLASRASWVEPEGREGDARFDAYPERSLADWHTDHGYGEP